MRARFGIYGTVWQVLDSTGRHAAWLAQLTLPHNLYRTPEPPPLPQAVPYIPSATGPPPGYRLVTSGVKLGHVGAVPEGAVFFSSLQGYLENGPIVNLVGRWVMGRALCCSNPASERSGKAVVWQAQDIRQRCAATCNCAARRKKYSLNLFYLINHYMMQQVAPHGARRGSCCQR